MGIIFWFVLFVLFFLFFVLFVSFSKTSKRIKTIKKKDLKKSKTQTQGDDWTNEITFLIRPCSPRVRVSMDMFLVFSSGRTVLITLRQTGTFTVCSITIHTCCGVQQSAFKWPNNRVLQGALECCEVMLSTLKCLYEYSPACITYVSAVECCRVLSGDLRWCIAF